MTNKTCMEVSLLSIYLSLFPFYSFIHIFIFIHIYFLKSQGWSSIKQRSGESDVVLMISLNSTWQPCRLKTSFSCFFQWRYCPYRLPLWISCSTSSLLQKLKIKVLLLHETHFFNLLCLVPERPHPSERRNVMGKVGCQGECEHTLHHLIRLLINGISLYHQWWTTSCLHSQSEQLKHQMEWEV